MRKEIIRTVEAVMVLMILAIGFYPAVSNAWNSYVASKMITHYQNESVQNAGLRNGETVFADENGVIGYLEIPSISVVLPIYEGTTDEILEKGVGHLTKSSLPIGGEGTRTILTGHRGLPSAELFTNLDKMGEGDQFFLHSAGKKLTYEVNDIRTVLPYETDSLGAVAGRDLATLVTCTPYGVNTHRLLVTGERVQDRKDADYIDLDLTPDCAFSDVGISQVMMRNGAVLAAAVLAVAGTGARLGWIWLLDWPREKQRERRRIRHLERQK